LNGTFTQEDSQKLAEFSKILMKHVKWDDLGTKELMQVYGLLMWYNGLGKKIQDNILEIKSEGSIDDTVDDQIDNSSNSTGDTE